MTSPKSKPKQSAFKVTDAARAQLREIADGRALGPGKYLRLALPPVWTGEGEFGIVIDDRGSGDPERDRCRQGISDIDQASIQTLHSFAADLLQARPLEAGLPPGFQVSAREKKLLRASPSARVSTLVTIRPSSESVMKA